MDAEVRNYPMVAQIDTNFRSKQETIENFGLKDYHCYIIRSAVVIPIIKGENKLRYLLKLRNPMGATKVTYKGPWSPGSKTWDRFPDVAE